MVNKKLVKSMEIQSGMKELLSVCKPCVEGKHPCTPIQKETSTHTDMLLGHGFSDVWGPAPVATPSNQQYYTLFIDDKSCQISVALLKKKNDTFTKYKSFVSHAKTETGIKIKALQTDGGGEYGSNEFSAYLKEKGQKHEITNPDTPPENGVSKCTNGYLMGHAWSMLHDAGLLKALWGHAVQHAVYIHNITLSKALPGNITPHETYFGQKPHISLL
jgi:hypothetical protein